MTQPAFELVDADAQDADWFGLWAPAPPGPVSFGVGGEAEAAPPADTMVWRANLPADPAQAAGQLEAGEARLRATQSALNRAPNQIESFVARAQAQSAAGVSFSIGGDEAFTDQESELLYLLEEARTGQPPAVSFSVGEAAPESMRRASGHFKAAIDRLTRIISNFAWVETSVEGQLLARTVIDWTGDTNTLAQAELNARQAAHHRRTVALSVASRGLYLNTFVIVTQGALKLAPLLTTPGSAVLALPIAWKSVSQVLAEIGKYRALASQSEEN